MYRFFSIISACLILLSCSSREKKNPYVLSDNKDYEHVNFNRIDQLIENFNKVDSTTQMKLINDNYEALLGFGMFADGVDTITRANVGFWSVWPATTAFMPEINKQYTDLSQESESIGLVISTLKQNNIDIPVDSFATVAWGKYNPVVLIDSLNICYIALNHYLGPEYELYTGWPSYICAFKTREMIPVDVAEAFVSTALPYDEKGSGTVLSRLLYEGARAVAKEAAVPSAGISNVLGLTPAALTVTRQNEAFMWQQLLKDNNLYSTDGDLISNLFSVRANSERISPDAPGRAVRLIGYNIVKSYIENNPDVELRFLLSPDFYNDGLNVLRKSNYAPKEN